MIKEKELKIAHCNIDSCADRGNADMLLKEVLAHNADIIIFTEYTNALNKRKRWKDIWCYFARSNSL